MQKISTIKTLMSGLALMAIPAMAQTPEPATFENFTLQPESYWIGDTEDEDYMKGTFESGSFEFSNYYFSDYGSWAFYGYANLTTTDFTSYVGAGQMKNCVGGGYKSKNYGVAYCDAFWGPAEIALPGFKEGVNVPGMWITNTAWVVNTILNGDGMGGTAFGQGDWLKVTFKGYDADNNEQSLDFYLADYRSADASEHYYIKDWAYCDLSSLGNVVKIVPSMSGSKNNEYGLLTPAYFAFDDLGAKKEATGVAAPAAEAEVNVTVANGVAIVTGSDADFKVTAVSAEGIAVSATASEGVAEIQLPSKGVNVIRVVSSTGVKTLKVINR